ncbi:hypothetical protein QAD02_001609 [Eretmocerus hayati]|uniref:Uncharacterized protein n=1 Tax=Eretmocerus hayati TaxID=131215 RepID=A0ACC2NLC0_9HYME|nr:hypothetical protein QAD02_001609 [Eretmocerus hayati]
MPKIPCNKCKKNITRGENTKIQCAICNNRYHSYCIGESLENGTSVRKCDECLGELTLNHLQTVESETIESSLENPKIESQPSHTPSQTRVSSKRQRSPSSPTSSSHTHKLARVISPPSTTHTMTSVMNQREQNLRVRREQIEASAPEWHQLFMLDYRATCASNDVRFTTIEKKSDCILQAMSHTDENETKITGIPSAVEAPLIESAWKILLEVGLTSPQNLILNHREWQKTGDNDSQRVVVVKLVGGGREMIMRNAKKLQDKTAQSIFGVGGNMRIYINQVYPRPVYTLLREARKTSEMLNYAPPVVKNMLVFMRETSESDLILVQDAADFKNFRPRIIPQDAQAASNSVRENGMETA